MIADEVPWPDLDPGIRPVVAAFVGAGFTTIASCQGHGEGDAWVVVQPQPGDVATRVLEDVEKLIRANDWWRNCTVSLDSEVGADPMHERHVWIKARWWGGVPYR